MIETLLITSIGLAVRCWFLSHRAKKAEGKLAEWYEYADEIYGIGKRAGVAKAPPYAPKKGQAK